MVSQFDFPGFSKYLKDEILNSGLSLNTIAIGAGINVSTLSRFVRGQTDLKLTTADRIIVAIKSHKNSSSLNPSNK